MQHETSSDIYGTEDGHLHMRLSPESRARREAVWRKAGKTPPWERRQGTGISAEVLNRKRRLILLAKG